MTICIPTLTSREVKFNAIRGEILRQCCALDHRSAVQNEGQWLIGSGQGAAFSPVVEIIWDRDSGEKAVGKKRQDMLERATGKFVCGVDDDDELHREYIRHILEGCQMDVDCVGFKVACWGYGPPGVMEPADVSIKYDTWASDVGEFKYVRCPHHLMPIRLEHALSAGFPVDGSKATFGEDAVYSFALRDKGLLKTEHYVDEFLYVIHHVGNKPPGE